MHKRRHPISRVRRCARRAELIFAGGFHSASKRNEAWVRQSLRISTTRVSLRFRTWPSQALPAPKPTLGLCLSKLFYCLQGLLCQLKKRGLGETVAEDPALSEIPDLALRMLRQLFTQTLYLAILLGVFECRNSSSMDRHQRQHQTSCWQRCAMRTERARQRASFKSVVAVHQRLNFSQP